MTQRRRMTIRLLIAVVALATVAIAPAGGAQARPRAHTAGTCSVGNGQNEGYSYLTFLWVHRTSCATGKRLARHHGHLTGWRCSSKTLDRSPVQYDARVTCHSGRRVVQWTFTQNT